MIYIKRYLSISFKYLFRKEELYQLPKVLDPIEALKPIVPERTVSPIEFTINGLTLQERCYRVDHAPNPKDKQVLSHIYACPDWNDIIPKGIDHLKTGIKLSNGISNVTIKLITDNLPYNHPINYLLHGYLPPLAYMNPHIKFSLEIHSIIENNQIVIQYKSKDEITLNGDVETTDDLLSNLASAFGVNSFNSPVIITEE